MMGVLLATLQAMVAWLFTGLFTATLHFTRFLDGQEDPVAIQTLGSDSELRLEQRTTELVDPDDPSKGTEQKTKVLAKVTSIPEGGDVFLVHARPGANFVEFEESGRTTVIKTVPESAAPKEIAKPPAKAHPAGPKTKRAKEKATAEAQAASDTAGTSAQEQGIA